MAASNSPAGSDAIGNSLDDYIRAIQSIVRSTNANSSATIASASTTDLGSSDGEAVTVTGSATITSFGTTSPGIVREVSFSGACILTNSSAIVLASGANYTTRAGDVIRFRSLGSGNWKQVTPPAFSYIPVQQGTGISQLSNVVKIGWSAASKLKATVDTTDLGNIALEPWVSGAYLPLTGGSLSGALTATALTAGGVSSSTVAGDSFPQFQLYRPSAPTYTPRQWIWYLDSNGTVGIRDVTGGGTALTIGLNGTTAVFNGTVTATNFTATSDKRLKKNVAKRNPRDLSSMLTFKWWKWRRDDAVGLGLVAQDVQAVAPEYVQTSDDGKLSIDKAGIALEAVMALADRVRKLEGK